MEEFFSSVMGIDYSAVLHERNISFPTVRVESDFKRRMKYGDQIDMEVRILKIGQSSITWGYRGYLHEDEKVIVVEGNNVTVCVRTNTFEKIDVPPWLRNGLTDYMNSLE
jgi:acyl-CoA thioesterase FadM